MLTELLTKLLAISLVVAAEGFQIGHGMRSRAPALRVTAPVRCGFEVETVNEKTQEDLQVMNWPGLEKRTAPFEQSAATGELKMVFIKEGSATVAAEGETPVQVSKGQMVMISDGTTAWSDVSESGLILLSSVVDNAEEEVEYKVAPSADTPAKTEPEGDMSIKEGAIVLGAGLLSGGLISFGLKLFLSEG